MCQTTRKRQGGPLNLVAAQNPLEIRMTAAMAGAERRNLRDRLSMPGVGGLAAKGLSMPPQCHVLVMTEAPNQTAELRMDVKIYVRTTVHFRSCSNSANA